MVDNQEEVVQEEQVQEEVAPQEEQVQEAAPEVEAPAQEDSYQARNFRELREKSQRIQQERDEALRRLQVIEQAKTAAEQPKEPEYSLNPDDLVEGKHLSKYDKKMKDLEKQLKSYQKQSQEVVVEAKIKNKFPDFDKVVTPDTIALLRDTHPEIAETIATNGNMYNQAVSAYTMIKNLNIYKEEKNQHEKQLIQQNNAKPRSVASVSPQQGNTPLSRANAFAEGLTPELKEQMLKEMQQARKSY